MTVIIQETFFPNLRPPSSKGLVLSTNVLSTPKTFSLNTLKTCCSYALPSPPKSNTLKTCSNYALPSPPKSNTLKTCSSYALPSPPKSNTLKTCSSYALPSPPKTFWVITRPRPKRLGAESGSVFFNFFFISLCYKSALLRR